MNRTLQTFLLALVHFIFAREDKQKNNHLRNIDLVKARSKVCFETPEAQIARYTKDYPGRNILYIFILY